MLTRSKSPSGCGSHGFSLIELMVSLFIGMLVIAGAISLIVAINRANSETIQGTRIDQELRALASVIADELKRTRRVHDAVCYVGQASSTSVCGTTCTTAPCPGPFDSFTITDLAGTSTTDGDCILYGYQDANLNDPSVSNPDFTNNYLAIHRDSTAKSIVLAKSTSAVTCSSSGTTLSSPQVTIIDMRFSCVSIGTSVSRTNGTSASCSEIDLTLTGSLKTGDNPTNSVTTSISHTYTLPIFIRSGAVKTS